VACREKCGGGILAGPAARQTFSSGSSATRFRLSVAAEFSG